MTDTPISTEELVHGDGGALPSEPGGSVRAARANAMVLLDYQSQIVFDPPRAFEIFVLAPND